MTAHVANEALMGAQGLAELGRQLRVDSIRMAKLAGSGHPTSSMSAADLVAVLVAKHLAIDPQFPDALGNDHLVFSKGHASPLLWSAWKALGILTEDDLRTYRRRGSRLEGHPTPRAPGVPVATGSLGLGLPTGVGLAMAARYLDHTDARVWVLCGDSEMAEGSMWEGIEHAGWMRLPNLVAIVDVNRLGQTGPTRHGWDLDAYRRRFESFDWQAILVDGHEIAEIDRAYDLARLSDRPVAVIARTVKGSGAVETADVEGKHGAPLEDPDRAIEELGGTRDVVVTPRGPAPAVARPPVPPAPLELPSWPPGASVATREAFGEAAVTVGRARPDLVALDGEVGNSTHLELLADSQPERFFQMYISEQLMASVGVGLQVTGWRPLMTTFGAFWSRAHDVLRMAVVGQADLCLCGSHAGVSIGEDGPSQMGLEDLATMRALHGTTVLCPCDANQTAALLARMVETPGLSYLRTSRGATPVIYEPGTAFEIGGSVVVRSSPDDSVTIVGAGVTVHEALAAAERLAETGVRVRVVDAYSIKPLDRAGIVRAVADTKRLVVVEDHRPEGGLGEAVLSALATAGAAPSVRHLAVRILPSSAKPDEQRRAAGIDGAAITEAVISLLTPGV